MPFPTSFGVYLTDDTRYHSGAIDRKCNPEKHLLTIGKTAES